MRSSTSKRELFASKPGFILAAAGSAVGLGNMWRFSYQAADGGGAAFVVAYIAMTFLIGLPIMVSEFAIGRTTRRSPVGAFMSLGGAKWAPIGYLAVLTPLLILAYFSVITGWVLRYIYDAFAGFSGEPANHFGAISEGTAAVVLHLVAMASTVLIVSFGVRKGIERASLILMPLLLLLLIGFVIWSATLDGSGSGYLFYLAPSLAELSDINVIRQAAAQTFLSLSVGMGVMITYGSYIDNQHNLIGEGAAVSMLDFSVAFIGGLVVFPIIFALGLSATIGESTVGTLFVSLPAAFLELGGVGKVVGALFFIALLVAGLTSAISLLEVAVASLVDQYDLRRGVAVAIAASFAGLLGVLPALNQDWLVTLDKLAGEIFVVIGALASLLLARRCLNNSTDFIAAGSGRISRRLLPILTLLIRWVAPLVVGAILLLAIATALGQ